MGGQVPGKYGEGIRNSADVCHFISWRHGEFEAGVIKGSSVGEKTPWQHLAIKIFKKDKQNRAFCTSQSKLVTYEFMMKGEKCLLSYVSVITKQNPQD